MQKIIIEVPQEMLDIAKSKDPNKKLADACLYCPFSSEMCGSPDPMSMDYPSWVTLINAHAKQKKLTHNMIAERVNLSKSTVDSVLSGKNKDIRAATMRDITRSVIGDEWDRHTCRFAAMLFSGDFEEFEKQTEVLGHELESKKRELEAARDNGLEKTAYLREEIAILKEELDFLRKENEKKDKIIEWLMSK